jgi:HD-GYP domain-containing protein (c-di-GMP phosphodiesterase class II)
MHNLTVRKGTLTQEDRFTINNHIVQTLIMLRRIPWPKHLARVPDLTASHHERLDGQGYPRKLNATELTLPDRIMAMVDIFEALTAADRPYKAAKTLSESFRIMAGMARGQHIDAQLLHYFLDSGLWLDFAKENLLPTQIDRLDLEEIHAMIEGQGVA